MNQGRRYSRETERIANEAFERAILGGSTVYVNGVRVASERGQEDFWSHIPREEMGIRERRGITDRVFVYVALSAVTVGALGLLAMAAMELLKSVGMWLGI
jgi:hypothetical protein